MGWRQLLLSSKEKKKTLLGVIMAGVAMVVDVCRT